MLFGFILADNNTFFSRIGSYTWKSTWGPEYHQSTVISLSGLVLASLLSFGELLIKNTSVSIHHESDPPIARKEE